MAPRADFDDWASDPKAFLQHCRNVGVIRTDGFPKSTGAWNRELKQNPGDGTLWDSWPTGRC